MNENSNIPNQADWEKLLAFLEQEEQDETKLNAEERRALAELKQLIAETSTALSSYNQFDVSEKWKVVKAKLKIDGSPIEQIVEDERYEHKKATKLWPRIVVAAAAVATIVFGVWFFNYRAAVILNSVQDLGLAKNIDIPPGKQGATLTLANGKKIRLSDAANGEIAKESGITVRKTADGQVVYEILNQVQDDDRINPSSRTEGRDLSSGGKDLSSLRSVEMTNVLSTAKGETYVIILPDQTKVWLNAASSLTYNANLLERGLRKVKLAGEAYFQVAKDKTHPFIVQTDKQSIEVLGTHFNVSAYADESSQKTTLLEGSVKISNGQRSKTLVPGNQAVSERGQIRVSEVDAELAVAWKNNKFVFERQGIKDIMRSIGRWYNVEIIYDGEPTKETFWGSVSRFDNVSTVLRQLEASGKVHFKIEARRIYVLP